LRDGLAQRRARALSEKLAMRAAPCWITVDPEGPLAFILPSWWGSLGDAAIIRGLAEQFHDTPLRLIGWEKRVSMNRWLPERDAELVPALSSWRSLDASIVPMRALAALNGARGVIWCAADTADGYHGKSGVLAATGALRLAAAAGMPAGVVNFSWGLDGPMTARTAMRRLPADVALWARDPISAGHAASQLRRDVRLGTDAAFALVAAAGPASMAVRALTSTPIIICVTEQTVRWCGGERKQVVRDLADLLEGLIVRLDVDIAMLPHDLRSPSGEGDRGDEAVLREVLGELSPSAAERCVALRPSGPEDARAAVAGARLVVTSRMHLAIAALGENVPVVVLSDHPKVPGMLEQVDQVDVLQPCRALADVERLLEHIVGVDRSRDARRASIAEGMLGVRARLSEMVAALVAE